MAAAPHPTRSFEKQGVIPKILHQTARTKEVSWEEARLAQRLRRMQPGWKYRLWDDDDNARLVAERFPEYVRRYAAIPFGVARADVARYVYLHAHGGFYLDTDYKLLRPLDDALRAAPCLIPLEGADPQGGKATPDYLGLGNAIMGSEPGHRFWGDLVRHIFEVLRPDQLRRRDAIIPATGPEAVTRFYLARADRYPDISLPEKNRFYPSMSWLGQRTSAGPDTYGVHLHWGSWRDAPPTVAAKTLVRRKLNGLLS